MAEISATQWQELSPLLDELLEAQHDERKRRLAEIGVSDQALAMQLETLLGERTAIERDAFLEGGAFSAIDEPSLVGHTIGAYTLERPLGEGGMGAVWLGRRSDGRYEGQVAVKFLNLALLARGGAERFAREGNMLARLTHPNIARLLDAGVATSTTVGGQPYLVLEYIEGVPIDRYCDSNGLSIDKRLRLFLDVLAAVAHAHTNLILHRDLKPSNILVTGQGEVKLLDFGIGKLLAEQNTAGSATELTHLAGRAFTPDYAAPEQVQGGDVTTATDVYALGVLLYLLLVGRHPTAQPTATQVDRLRAVVEAEPPRPSSAIAGVASDAIAGVMRARAASSHKLVRALRGDLDNIIAKALKKSPTERYPTVSAFADDIRRHLSHEPISARRDALGYRIAKFVRRYRVGVSAVTLTLLTLIAGIFGTAWQAQEARRAQSRAEANAAEARQEREAAQFEARVARANHEFVSQLFGDAMRAAESNQMRSQLDRARELLRRRYADDPVVHSVLLFQLAGRFAELREPKREAEVMEEIQILSMRANEPSLSAAVACIKAYDLIQDGHVEAARPHVAEGLRLMNRAVRPLSVAGFECYRADAMLASATGDHARGVAQMQRWIGQLEREGLDKTRLYLNSLGSLAYIQATAGDSVSALTVSRRSRALNEALGSEATLSSQIELVREGALLFELGRIREAIEVDREMLQRFATMEAGGTPPPYFLVHPARHEIVGGNLDRGVARLQSILPKFERDGPETLARGVIFDLAAAYVLQGRNLEAHSMLNRFEASLAKAPPRPRDRIDAARLGVEIALGARNPAELMQALDALEAALAVIGPPRFTASQGYVVAGLGRLAQGNADIARLHGAQALKLATANAIDGQGSAWIGAAQLLLARIALAENDGATARSYLSSAAGQFADTLEADHRWRIDVESLRSRL